MNRWIRKFLGANARSAAALLATAMGIAVPSVALAENGLKASIYEFSEDLPTFDRSRLLLTRVDPTIDFDFKGGAPATGLKSDFFAIRWTGYLLPPETADYTLCTCSDDGIRVFLDGKSVIDEFRDRGANQLDKAQPVHLESGKKYKIRVDYYERGGEASVRLFWSKTDQCLVQKDTDGVTDLACGKNKFQAGMSVIPTTALEPETTELSDANKACNTPVTYLGSSDAPNPDDVNTQRALRLFERLTGASTPLFDSRITEMKKLIDQGKSKEAARIATADPRFYDLTVRHLAARISTRAQTADAPLNDFIATFVGVTRDRIPATKLLTGNFLYRASSVYFWGSEADAYNRDYLVSTNRHYEEIEKQGLPLKCALRPLQNGGEIPDSFIQRVAKPNGMMEINPDPAGLLTSRAFMSSHAIAGTNRRIIEKAFEHFLCTPIDGWRDAENVDTRIGRDITRFPSGGNLTQFQQECKSCHGQVDGLRGAFARFHFENEITKYAPFFAVASSSSAAENANNMKQDPPGVALKMNHNVNYEQGYYTTDDSWINFATRRSNATRFGWSGKTSGRGAQEFGQMLSNSTAFGSCMTKRVYREVCKKDPSTLLDSWIAEVASEFSKHGYDLKDLFETVAIHCMN